MFFSSKDERYLHLAIIIALGVLGFFLRYYNLSFQSLWYDEGASYIDSQNVFENLGHWIEMTPPLFYLIEGFNLTLFGETEFAIRFAPAICGSLCIPLTYIITKRMTDSTPISVFTALLISVSELHIYFSQDGRPYGIISLLFLIQFYLYQKIIKDNSIKIWIIFALVSLLSIHISYFMAIPSLLFNFHFFIFNIKYWIKDKKRFNNALLSGLLITIGVIPLLSAIKRTYTVVTNDAIWETGLELLRSCLLSIFYNNTALMIFSVIIITVGLLLLHQTNKQEATLLMLMCIIPLGFLCLVSHTMRAHVRYVIYIVPVFYLSFVISSFVIVEKTITHYEKIKKYSKLIASTICVSMIIVAALSLPAYYTTVYKDDFRSMGHNLYQFTDDQDYVAFVPNDMAGMYGTLSFYYSYDDDHTVAYGVSTRQNAIIMYNMVYDRNQDDGINRRIFMVTSDEQLKCMEVKEWIWGLSPDDCDVLVAYRCHGLTLYELIPHNRLSEE